MTSRLLVIGAGGLVGRTVAEHFRRAGRPVATASHQPGADLHVDLAAGALPEPPADAAHALICSAISNIDACRRDPQATRRFNVDNTGRLIDLLRRRGVTPVFCSSDAVFEGDRGGYREDEERRPVMAYGAQKKEIEDHLLASSEPHLILRFGKLVELAPEDASPLGGLVRALSAGERVKAAHDQHLSLTDVADAARAVELLLAAGETGVWHVANPRPTTRLAMARAVARHLGREALVERVSIDDFDFLEPRPKNPVLNSDRFRARFGFEFGDPLAELARLGGP